MFLCVLHAHLLIVSMILCLFYILLLFFLLFFLYTVFVLFVDELMILNAQFWLQKLIRGGKASSGAFAALAQEDL